MIFPFVATADHKKATVDLIIAAIDYEKHIA